MSRSEQSRTPETNSSSLGRKIKRPARLAFYLAAGAAGILLLSGARAVPATELIVDTPTPTSTPVSSPTNIPDTKPSVTATSTPKQERVIIGFDGLGAQPGKGALDSVKAIVEEPGFSDKDTFKMYIVRPADSSHPTLSDVERAYDLYQAHPSRLIDAIGLSMGSWEAGLLVTAHPNVQFNCAQLVSGRRWDLDNRKLSEMINAGLITPGLKELYSQRPNPRPVATNIKDVNTSSDLGTADTVPGEDSLINLILIKGHPVSPEDPDYFNLGPVGHVPHPGQIAEVYKQACAA